MSDPLPSPSSGVPHGVRTTRRRGRMTEAKREAITTLLPRWTVPRPLTVSALHEAFGRTAPLLLDVGVGTGEATRHWAATHPDHDVVAVELHRPGIARLCQALEADGPPNVRVLEADVLALLEDLSGRPSPQPSRPMPGEGGTRSPTASPAHGDAAGPEPRTPVRFAQVRVLFPDPWPKARHHRRRLVDPWFVAAVADVLDPGGRLLLATDWDDYADHMRAVLATEERLIPEPDPASGSISAAARTPAHRQDAGWRSARPDRPVTTYERRGLRAGRTVTDLVLRRSAR